MAIRPKHSIIGKITTLFLVLGLALNLMALYTMLNKEEKTHTAIGAGHYSLITGALRASLEQEPLEGNQVSLDNKSLIRTMDSLTEQENFPLMRLYDGSGDLIHQAGNLTTGPKEQATGPLLSREELQAMAAQFTPANQDQAQLLPTSLSNDPAPPRLVFPITGTGPMSKAPPATASPSPAENGFAGNHQTGTIHRNLAGFIEILPSPDNPLTAFKKYSTAGFITWGIIFAILLITVFVSVYIWVERPLTTLARLVTKAETDDFMIRMPKLNNQDQIGLLAASFNRMLIKITDLRAGMIDTDMSLQTAVARKKRFEEQNLKFEVTNQQLAISVKNMELLMELTRKLNATLDLDTVTSELVQVLTDRMDIPRFALLLRGEALGSDRQAEKLVSRGIPKLDSNQLKATMDGVPEQVMKGGQVVAVSNLSLERGFRPSTPLHGSTGSMVALPVKSRLGVFGVLICSRPELDAFTDGEQKMLRAITDGASLAITNSLLHRRSLECLPPGARQG